MNLKNLIPKNIFKNNALTNIYKFIDSKYTLNNIIIAGLLIYISLISVYTPRVIIAFVNNTIVKLIILGCIIIFGKNDIILGLFLSIALLISINLDNSVSLLEKKEHFADTNVKKKKTIKSYEKIKRKRN